MKAVKVDPARRIRLSMLAPGDVYEPEIVSADEITLRRVPAPRRSAPRPANVKVEKRRGYSVGVLDRKINEAALREALAEFP